MAWYNLQQKRGKDSFFYGPFPLVLSHQIEDINSIHHYFPACTGWL